LFVAFLEDVLQDMLKTRIKSALINSGALRIASRLIANGVAILMYHSVVDNPGEHFEIFGGMGHSTSVFRQQMELLAREFHPITLDEAFRFVQSEEVLPRRSVVVTFDDGYSDNLQVAVPVLNEVGVPATFYVTVDCVERQRLPWPSRLRYALFTTKATNWLDSEGQSWPLREQASRGKAFDRASEFCAKLAGREQEDFVSAAERQLQSAVMNGPPMMSWDEVRATAKQGHIVGSHTMTHPNMAYVGEDALRRELAESKTPNRRSGGPLLVSLSRAATPLDRTDTCPQSRMRLSNRCHNGCRTCAPAR
jgi:hypothetical protein